MQHGNILAVDLGLRCGLARFAADGVLDAYRSTHFSNRAALKRAVAGILHEHQPVALLVLEGDAALAAIWSKAAAKLPDPPRVLVVSAEDWRPTVLLDRHQRSGADAKRHADTRAHELIEEGRAPRPKGALRHDVAEAICMGAWAVAEHLQPED